MHVAEFKAGGAGTTLLTIGLGSCVAIALYDPEARVGGLAHILLPSPALSRRDQSPGKFPQTAIPLLLQDMVVLGARPARITARLAGGASMFTNLQPAGHHPDGRAQPRGRPRGADPPQVSRSSAAPSAAISGARSGSAYRGRAAGGLDRCARV